MRAENFSPPAGVTAGFAAAAGADPEERSRFAAARFIGEVALLADRLQGEARDPRNVLPCGESFSSHAPWLLSMAYQVKQHTSRAGYEHIRSGAFSVSMSA